MKYLFILNDPPYGTERSYNGSSSRERTGENRKETQSRCS